MDVSDQTRQVSLDFPYSQLPQVDFFLYPPVAPVTPDEKRSLAAKLALDKPMPGDGVFTIFVSIPYCRSRCHSCHFFKGLLPPRADRHALLDDYLDCLEAQVQKYAGTVRLSTARCEVVYVGGGTGSLLAPDQVCRLIGLISGSFAVASRSEITLEGNPLDFSREYLSQVKGSGITRLSIGVQSFQDAVLWAVGSSHNGNAAHDAVRNALAVGFETINVDLLYKLPGQTIAEWQQDLQTAVDYSPNSITVYAYVIHPGSAAERLIARERMEQPIDLDTEQAWYLWTLEFLEQHGYLETMKGYFARPGHEKRYGTLNYKSCCEYIGLGAGAYSFVNGYQFSTCDEAEVYKEQVRSGLFPVADLLSVQASKQTMMERFAIMNFFFSSLNRQEFGGRFGADPLAVFPQTFQKLGRHGLVVIDDGEIRLTDLGKKWRECILYEFYADAFKSNRVDERQRQAAQAAE